MPVVCQLLYRHKGVCIIDVAKGFIVKETTEPESHITPSFTQYALLICDVRHQWPSVYIPVRLRQIDRFGSPAVRSNGVSFTTTKPALVRSRPIGLSGSDTVYDMV